MDLHTRKALPALMMSFLLHAAGDGLLKNFVPGHLGHEIVAHHWNMFGFSLCMCWFGVVLNRPAKEMARMCFLSCILQCYCTCTKGIYKKA